MNPTKARATRRAGTSPRKESGKPKPPADPVTAWAKDVVAGRIVAGPHVRNAARRHLDDLVHGPARGLTWDLDAALRAINFFPDVLRLNGGQFEGKPFVLHPSQVFRVGSLFGWKRADGTRRFRRFYDEEGKGNGKSPMLAGIGMYCLVADSEARAEVYAAGSKKDQAMVLFRDAVAMRELSPMLTRELTPSGGNPVWNLAYMRTGSFFRPISSDDGQSGPRPSCALCDEVHEHKNSTVIEMLERGFKWRRQPMLVMATNSGSDRNTVCWQEHQHAVRCAAGTREVDEKATYVGEVIDDSTFSFVCSLDAASTETFAFGAAMRHMLKSCTCHSVSTTQIDRLQAEVYASHVTADGTELRAVSGARNTQTNQSSGREFAHPATESGLSSDQRQPRPVAGSTKSDGKRRTLTASDNTSATGWHSDPDTDWQRVRSSAFGSTVSPIGTTRASSPHRKASARSAGRSRGGSASITATAPGNSEDCSVSNATRELVFSEIIQAVWNEHSPTCEVRKAKPEGPNLKVHIPADDPLTDPTCWAKANPLLGVTVKEDYLAGVMRQAVQIPGKMNGILRLHACVWTDADTAWMARDALEAVLSDFDPSEHAGEIVKAGIDLSATQDITAAAFCVETGTVEVERDDGQTATLPTYDIWVEAWTPKDTLDQRALRDEAPYDLWAKDGWLNAVPGKVIRMDFVAARIAEIAAEYQFEELGYDAYAFRKNLEPELDAMGVTVRLTEHPQGGKRRAKVADDVVEAARSAGEEPPQGLWMPGSIRELETLILEKRVRLRRSPVLISAMMSAVTEEDAFGNKWFSKRKATNRIDAAVAVAMAVGVATAETVAPGGRSFWESDEATAAPPN